MTKATYTPFNVISNPREIRRKLGMKQQDFWSRIGVTQSGGSRYEYGRSMPRPVRELLRMVHVEQINLANIKREAFDIAQYLRKPTPTSTEACKKPCSSSTRTPTTLTRSQHESDQIQQRYGERAARRYQDAGMLTDRHLDCISFHDQLQGEARGAGDDLYKEASNWR